MLNAPDIDSDPDVFVLIPATDFADTGLKQMYFAIRASTLFV